MARAKITVHFEDGSSVEFNPNRPRLLLDLEKRHGVQGPETNAQMMWLAYHALVEMPGKDGEVNFDDWVDSIEELEVPEDKADEGKAGQS